MNMLNKMLILLNSLLTIAATGCTTDPFEDKVYESEIAESDNHAAYYDNVFIGTNSYTGAPMSYDEVMNMIRTGEAYGEFLDSFYLVETVRALPIEECEGLSGWVEDYADRTVYEVDIIEDLLTGEEIDRTEYIFVSMGNAQWQDAGDPIYAPGERFTVALAKPQEGCDFLRTPGSFMFRYDAVEEDGEIKLYSRNNAEIDALNLDSSVNIDQCKITSTTNNPAVYTQAVELDELVSFLREDWSTRIMSVHYAQEG